MDVSIIIVNYNTKELLKNCLSSIFEQTKNIEFEVIVSDNGSVDGSIEMLKTEFLQVILIENNANLGFGVANNKAMDIAQGKYIFLLNSDTVLLNNAVKIFYDFWEQYPDQESLGAIGCNLLNEKNQITHSWGKFPRLTNSIKELIEINLKILIKTIFHVIHYNYQHFLEKNKIQNKYIGEVDYITGADLFMKNIHNIRFNEKFFLYYEETELQYRLWKENKKRLIIDGPKIQHIQGGTTKTKDDFYLYSSFSVIQDFSSTIIYFLIHKKNIFGIFIIKVLILLVLSNPFFIKKTNKYFKYILFLS